MDEKTLRMECGCGTKKNDDDNNNNEKSNFVQDSEGIKVEK